VARCNVPLQSERIMKSSSIKLRVRYPETDKMGVVHHTNYFVYFEMGRLEYLRSLGLPYPELEKENTQLAVLEAHCKYKAPARFDDVLVVETWLSGLSYAQMELSYKIWREEASDEDSRGTSPHTATQPRTLLAEGSTTLVCIDDNLKLKRIPDRIRNILPSEDTA